MNNNTSYETQAIDLSLLSVLDITKEGKVVSAEKWVELWTLVFQHINKIDTFCVDMQATLDNWHIAEEALTELSKDVQMKYASLSTGFTHYGEAPPQNPHINFWVRRMKDNSPHRFITNADIDISFNPDSENAQSGKAVNEAISGILPIDENTELVFNGGDVDGGVSVDIVVDTVLSKTSNNPIANKPVAIKFGEILGVIEQAKKDILLSAYPVGALFISTDSTSPATLFGGTWVRIKDRFLLAAGDTYPLGATGGEATHTLTVDEMPIHSHYQKRFWGESGGVEAIKAYAHGAEFRKDKAYQYPNESTIDEETFNTGGSQPHNNMPPYLAVYVWKRTA